jgi:DNA-binding protein H-NS
MSLSELRTTLAAVNAQIPKTEARERSAFIGEVQKLASARGLSLEDVMGNSGSARRSTKGRSVPVKFRDPKSGAEWSGRGRSPKWFDRKHSERFQVAESA